MRSLLFRQVKYFPALIIGLTLVTISDCSGSENVEESSAEIPRESTSITRRHDAVMSELKNLPGHAWAGSYYQGDHLGENITMSLAPASGISVTNYGCLGYYGGNEGSLKVLPDGHVKFEFNLPNEQKDGFPDEVIPVRWVERHYLIHPSRMFDFVKAINSNMEPSILGMSSFLLLKGDEAKAVKGLPDLPEPYRSAIRAVPLNASVKSVDALPQKKNKFVCFSNYRISLDRGSEAGILPGMLFQVEAPDRIYERLTISTVEPGMAVGDLAIMSDSCESKKSVPDTSWVFTTGAYDPKFYERMKLRKNGGAG